MKVKLISAFGVLFTSIPFLYWSINTTNPAWQSYFAGLSSSLVVLGVGIFIINYHLENATRREAVKALFLLSQKSIADFHNELLRECWAIFGRDEFGNIVDEFRNAKSDVSALKKEYREKVYSMYFNSPILQKKVIELENMLSELTRMVGWSLDSQLLTATLVARTEIVDLKSTILDGSDEAINQVTMSLLKIDGTTGAARATLMKLAGIKESA